MTDANRPAVLWWELALAVLAWLPAAALFYRPNITYRHTADLSLDGDAQTLGIWLVLACLALVATRPWQNRSRYGTGIRWIGVVSAGCGLALVVFFFLPWGRYQAIKFETHRLNLHVTNYEDGLRGDLSRELFDPQVGPYLTADAALLKTLVERDQLLTEPLAARLVMASLLDQGLDWDQLRGLPGGKNLLMGALLAEPDAWPDQPATHPPLQPDPEQGLTCGLFSREQVARTLADYVSTLDGADWHALEPAVVACMHFPDLATETQRARVFTAWSSAFRDAGQLAVQALSMRAELIDLLGSTRTVRLAVVTKGEFQQSYKEELTRVLPLMAAGLVHACGVKTVPAQPDQADLLITLELGEVPHYDWSRPTYRYETVVTQRRGYGRYAIPQTVTESRRVADGSERMTEYAPTARVLFRYAGKEIVMGPLIVQWHRYFYDAEQHRYPDSPDDLYGRLWPLGVHLDWFLFKRPDEY
ncbi:MAG: hypothetical protein AB7S38_35330 [Vulcanimicrobiota bacterium]